MFFLIVINLNKRQFKFFNKVKIIKSDQTSFIIITLCFIIIFTIVIVFFFMFLAFSLFILFFNLIIYYFILFIFYTNSDL